MKKNILSIIVFSFLFFSCNKDNNPVIPEEDQINYSGKVGSERTYRITTQWFKFATTSPFIEVPDSLLDKLTFPDSLRLTGCINYELISQRMAEIDSDYYSQLNTTILKEYYKNEFADWKQHNLNYEIEALKENLTYIPTELNNILWNRWLETPDILQELFSVPSYLVCLKKPLEIGSFWIRGSLQIPNDSGGYSTYQEEAEVVAKEEIQVSAGSFTAYKIAIITHWVELNVRLTGTYEYYVPGVGLVLLETKGTVESSINNQTIYYDQVYRKELISFNN